MAINMAHHVMEGDVVKSKSAQGGRKCIPDTPLMNCFLHSFPLDLN